LVSLCKSTLIDYKNLEEVLDLVEKFNIDIDVDDLVMSFLSKIMEASKEAVNTIDFDDMIWIPIIKNWTGPTYDWVFVDESQDLNKIQFELIKKCCGKNTRIVAVGDRRQSIYAFRGADTNSIDRFVKEFKAVELPLSICYRCPKKVIEAAKEFVPEIETFENAPEGEVSNINFEMFLDNVKDEDLVLCRTNAPIVRVAFGLIRRGIKAVVRGRDIGKGLVKIIKKYKATDINDLYMRLNNYMKTEEEKLLLIEEGKYPTSKKGMIMRVLDSIETLFVLMEDCKTIIQLETKIEQIFSDKAEGVVCSSVHKAKGLEAKNVYIVNFDMMPHPMAKTEEEIKQEYNIIYVALTRAKEKLFFIDDEL
jgi:superfamily I DNA/RNA helicase